MLQLVENSKNKISQDLIMNRAARRQQERAKKKAIKGGNFQMEMEMQMQIEMEMEMQWKSKLRSAKKIKAQRK